MKMDKFGYWIINEVVKPLTEKPEEDIPEADEENAETVNEPAVEAQKPKPMLGKCALSIRFENHGEYLKWKKYFGIGRQWEFIHTYPAIMRTEYEFKNSLEVEVMAKKIVQLLEMGFDVYSAQWMLKENETKEENKNGNI